MKNVFSLFFCLMAFCFFSSCKKDNKNEADLVGKWYLIKGEYNDHRSGNDDRYSDEFDDGSYIQLNSDGTLIEYMYEDTLSGTWKRSGNKLTFMYEEYDDYEFTIQTLTDSSLVIYYKEDIVDGDYDEETYHLKR